MGVRNKIGVVLIFIQTFLHILWSLLALTFDSLFRIFNSPKSELLSFYYYGELEIDGKNQLEGLHITKP